MKKQLLPIAFIGAFTVIILIAARVLHPHHPLMIIAGEESVGTWLSGMLLVIAATLSLLLATRVQTFFWFFITLFFLVLALDERFMFHENIKRRIIFSSHEQMPVWLIEFPVIAGACAGGIVSWLMWRRFNRIPRLLLIAATIFGSISVAIDIAAAGILWEEIAKLTAEFSVVTSLMIQYSNDNSRDIKSLS